ncbi:hypothetical protein MOQ72_29315 [Saccharopolyspora sp. K220]|uniref:hypothetical protein n=1 Tax=Saccharopolyspora soli TaxID=2926618 RepID=UPI001F55F17E|nr:hypothetical protein [Saccharopolyspora soli]MCI2421542.1 hypothetical protein [Saccharopolyspora soli]
MGPDLILAMVIAALVTRAWEQSKRRSAAAWEQTRQRAEETWERRAERVRSARSTGPRDPLWWPYAAGWTVAAVGSAAAAGLHGLVSGAIAGARGGYRVGREGARHGWGYRETWRQWRSRRAAMDIEKCQGCGANVHIEHLIVISEFGRVCPDCRQRPEEPHNRQQPEADEAPLWICGTCGIETYALRNDRWCPICGSANVHDSADVITHDSDEYRLCDGTCTNSDMSPTEAERQGLCGTCAGRGELVTDFGGVHRHIWCHDCKGTGKTFKSSANNAKDSTSSANPFANSTNPETDERERIYVHAERMDANEEPTKEIGGTAMGELLPVNSTALASTGEGYEDTIASLSTLALLLNKAYEEVQNLGEQLTVNSLDNDTINQISELTDVLESAAPLATNLHRHVEQRHAPVADAVASAGGSSNVAEKSWYDQY